MIVKVWFYFIVLTVQHGTTNGTISITTIVKLSCNFCKPAPDKCCIGSVIYPNFILTTAFCANSCQFVKIKHEDIRIIKIFTYQYLINIVKNSKYVERNDLALLYIENYVASKVKYLKLSAVDITAAIGKKALIPVLDSKNPRLQATIIKGCEQVTGYYICSTKAQHKGKKRNYCPEEEGIPLLLNEKVIGISGKMDKKDCHSQIIFIAVGPAHDWLKSEINRFTEYIFYRMMGSTIKTNNSESVTFSNSFTTQLLRIPILRAKFVEINDTEKLISITGTTSPEIDTREAEVTISMNISRKTRPNKTEVATLSPTHKFNRNKALVLVTKDYNNYSMPVQTQNKSSTTCNSVKINHTDIFATLITTAIKNTTTTKTRIKTLTNKRKRYTAITANLKLLTTSTMTSMHSTSSKIITKAIYSKLFESSSNSSTSIMDWFNEKYKKKLKKSPPPVLVLTTKYRTRATTEFEDLT